MNIFVIVGVAVFKKLSFEREREFKKINGNERLLSKFGIQTFKADT
jgi:hypothetical protein